MAFGDDAVCTLQLAKEVVDAILGGGPLNDVEAVRQVQTRSLVIAALKSGPVPTNDSLEDAVILGRHLRVGNSKSKVLSCRIARHYWQLQVPALFASTVTSWVKGTTLPLEIEVVDIE